MAKFKPIKRECSWCGNEFMAIREWHEYCQQKCRVETWISLHPSITPEVIARIEKIEKELGIKKE